jgi:hypothetical protein
VRHWREQDHPRDRRGRFADESWAGAVSDQMGGRRYWSQYRPGRDLVASGWAARRKQRHSEMLRDWEEQFWPYGDPIVGDAASEQGFDGLPATGTPDELDEAVRAGGIEIWRGYSPIYEAGERHGLDMRRGEPYDRARRAMGQWRDGLYLAGNGVYGQGTYASGSFDAAKTFGVWGRRYGYRSDDEGDPSYVQRMVLSPNARIYDYGTDPSVGLWTDRSRRSEPLADPGRMLAALGYDAMRIPAGEDDGTGLDEVQYVIFNRTALIIEEPPDGP